MPARNSLKQYISDSYYHIYNRGVEKRLIFLDEQDYGVFLSYLKEYLSFRDEKKLSDKLSDRELPYKEREKILRILKLNNFFHEITLLAYCLMPNHLHLFVKQKGALSIDQFIQSLATRYTMYFNKKYKRVGSLYQGAYKAILVETDAQFVYLSKYIHKQSIIHNPSLGTKGQTLRIWKQPSSYPEYLGKRRTEWIHPEEVLSHFSKINAKLSYKSFVEEKDDFSVIENKTLEDY